MNSPLYKAVHSVVMSQLKEWQIEGRWHDVTVRLLYMIKALSEHENDITAHAAGLKYEI